MYMLKAQNAKKVIVFISALAIICIGFAAVINFNSEAESPNAALAAPQEQIIKLQIDNPLMTVDGKEQEIDLGRGTAPIIVSDRTLLPVRAIIETVGGGVEWKNETQTATLTYNDKTVSLTIDSKVAYLNDEEKALDVAPSLINERTMLPIRFIAESFDFSVTWENETQTVTITVPKKVQSEDSDVSVVVSEAGGTKSTSADSSKVYMTTDITPEALVKIYEQSGFNAEGKVAVKMSTGEPPASNYLRPELIKDLVQNVNGTIVECNTAYGGSRSNTELHKQVAKDHGFYDIAEVDIMDEDDSLEISIADGTRIHKDYVGSHLANYNSLISLAHFKGHAMAGYGGAIKNMSIGIASAKGKRWIHTGGQSTETWMGADQDAFLEAMADATSGVVDFMEGKVVYINVMNRLSIDCDCDGNPSEPDMHDIGILASTDPVALDQACLDLVYAQKDGEGASLVQRINSRNGLHTLDQAEKIGLGSRTYNLISIE